MHSGVDKNNRRVTIDESNDRESYFCPLCHHPLIRKMGQIKVHHFAHKMGSACDSWFKEDNDFNEKWKSYFAVDEIENVLESNGEKHFADAKKGTTIFNFQVGFSFPKVSFATRNDFFLKNSKKVVWIFDAYASPIQYEYQEEGEIKRDYLNYQTTIRRETLNLTLYYVHAKSTLYRNVLSQKSENVEIYLQVNDNLLIRVEKVINYTSFMTSFEGTVFTLESFLKQFGIPYQEKAFSGFYLERKEQLDDTFLSELVKTSSDPEAKKALDSYLENKNDVSRNYLLSLLQVKHLPSEESPYFQSMENFVLDEFLFTKIEQALKWKEKKKKEEEKRLASYSSIKLDLPKKDTPSMLKKDNQKKLSGFEEVRLELDFTKDNESVEKTVNRNDVFYHVLAFRYQRRRVTLKQARTFVSDEDLLVEMSHEEQYYQKIIDAKQEFLSQEWFAEEKENGEVMYSLSLFGHEEHVLYVKKEGMYYPFYPDSFSPVINQLEKKRICSLSLVVCSKILFDITFEMDNGDEHVLIFSAKRYLG